MIEVMMTDPDYVDRALGIFGTCRSANADLDNCTIYVYCTTLREVISEYESIAIMSQVECVSTYKKCQGGRYGETLWEWLD
jgi:hypothetical protein